PFLWKQHLALPALPGSIISVPATAGIVGDFGSLRPGSPGQTFAWPCPERNGTTIDLSRVPPPSSGIAELMYLATPDAGWCALTRPGGEGLALAYDQSVFPSCWVFASYGAWRGLSVLVLEPCTGYPMSVNRGVDQGTHRVLAAGDTVRTRLALIPFDGLASVKSVDQRDGIWIVTGPPQARGDAYDEPHGGEG
ncbi:MAG: hypothetical protein LBG11_09180, partial [Bifidobacteriaceae bacterium]|nr:hypothetical protein [Bifidobacteriaceae bacterium]